MRRAVFFDRDGTLVESVHYLNRADQLVLLEGAAEALRELEEMGYLRILVTNQAAIAKGLLDEAGLREIQRELERMLAARGAALDAWYFCPLAGRASDRETVEHPDRKPGPGMLQRAAAEHGIDLSRSWMVGDMLSDVLAGRNAGCEGSIWVQSGAGEADLQDHPAVDLVARDVSEVPALIRQRRRD